MIRIRRRLASTRWAAVVCLATASTAVGNGSTTWSSPDQAPGTAASPAGWITQWDVLYGGFRQLDEIAALADGSGWGVDVALSDRVDHSTFVRFGPDEVRALQSEAGIAVRSLALTDAGGWAVGESGDGGIVFRLSGERWIRVMGVPDPLHAVSLTAIDSSRGWAVGDHGLVLALGPSGWLVEEFPDRLARLRAVAALSSNEAWALDEAGWLWHRTAEGWSKLDAPRARGALAMAFSPSGRGLVVGSAFLEYLDGVWNEIPAPGARATSIAWAGSDALAAVDGGVSRWDGASWAAVGLPAGPVAAEAIDQIAAAGTVWAASDRNGVIVVAAPSPEVVWPRIGALLDIDAGLDGLAWAVGVSHGLGGVGSSPKDGRWDLALELPPGASLSGVSLLTADEGWAVGATFVGSEARTSVWRLTPSGWVSISAGPNWGLSSVATLSEADAFAAGQGSAARWNGDSWKLFEGAPFGNLTGPLAIERGGLEPEGWFAARGGVYHLVVNDWKLIELAPMLDPTGELNAIVADPTGGVWALGPRDVIRIEADETVRVLPQPPATELRDLSVSPSGAVWLLAEPEGLFRWDVVANSWENHPLGFAGNRVDPLRIDALDQEHDPSLPPPEGWEGHDVWIAGTAAVARFRVVKPTYSTFLPSTLRGGRLSE